jgi:hypothetical protein
MMARQRGSKSSCRSCEAGTLKVIPNGEEIMNTIFGAAGFKDGGDRFFQVEPMSPSATAEPGRLDAQNKARELDSRSTRPQPTPCSRTAI